MEKGKVSGQRAYDLMRQHFMFVYEVDGERLSLKECREKRIPYEKMTTQNSKTVWIADRTKTYFP